MCAYLYFLPFSANKIPVNVTHWAFNFKWKHFKKIQANVTHLDNYRTLRFTFY